MGLLIVNQASLYLCQWRRTGKLRDREASFRVLHELQLVKCVGHGSEFGINSGL